VALGLTQRLTELPGASPGVKGGRCVRLTTLPPSCAGCHEIGSFNLLEPSGPLQAWLGIALPLYQGKKTLFYPLVQACEFSLKPLFVSFLTFEATLVVHVLVYSSLLILFLKQM
jgi:hypothetical protein